MMLRSGFLFTALSLVYIWPLQAQQPVLQEIKKVGEFSGKGTVVDIQPGEIIIRDADGARQAYIVQDKDERFVSLDGNDYIVSMPARIDVRGTLPGKLLEQGMVVQFRGEINRGGRTGRPVKKIKVVSGNQDSLLLRPASEPSGKDFVLCDFIGIIQRFANQTMYLVVPKSNLAPTQRIKVKVADDAFFDIRADDLNRVKDGDRVVAFRGDKMANGALVIRDISVKLTAERTIATPSYSDQLYLKYSKLSDEPMEPRQEVSEHFILYTDISPRSAKVLLAKLETMYGFLSRYYRKKPRNPIECYVVADLEKFRDQRLDPIGIKKIAERAGVTSSRSFALVKGNRIRGKRTQSIVYSCDDHGVVQHEAVHAYCSMAFGSSGPVWYAEGMAEIGQYWAPEQQAVHIDPVVIEYLTNAPKKSMSNIVAAGQITGDSWKAYAWRWALCHLLSNNPNYAKRFKELGMNMMADKKDSFAKAFGDVAEKISFEYDQFVANFDNGYRADLCAWQWRDDVKDLESRAGFSVLAQHGWQATSVGVRKGQQYDFICPAMKDENGKKQPQSWSINDSATAVSPNGNPRGDGKLIGVILHEHKLSETFEIGTRLSNWSPPASGHLYVRCQESWNALDDNAGQLRVYIRKASNR